jgi:glycosyltransferase involved in cell wall biosynthesis
MKIVCISAAQIPSDTANSIQVMKACQAFVQLGHSATLLVPQNQQHPTGTMSAIPYGYDVSNQQLIEHYGLQMTFPIEWLPSPNRRLFPWKAAWRARGLSANLLYVWPLQSAALGLLAGMPTLLELHDLPTGAGPLWLRLVRMLPGRKRLLPISDALRRLLHLPEAQTVIAPDGVDLERYAALPDPVFARHILGLPETPSVLCTGHLYAGRGADLFLALAAKFPQAGFIWVGGRPADVKTWRERAVGLANVTFTGFVPNERIPLYQAAAEVLLMPYQRTVATSSGGNTAAICSPMKMFEYMAAGRAILSSDLPVLHEVLDGSMAVFCPSDDPRAWESALGELLKDEKQRLRLAQAARSAVEQYTWVKRARKVLEGFVEIPA